MRYVILWVYFFLFNDTATTEIYTYGHTLSLHDALPISRRIRPGRGGLPAFPAPWATPQRGHQPVGQRATPQRPGMFGRSEEHTSELQSLMRISYAVFCLKKKNNENPQITIHALSLQP